MAPRRRQQLPWVLVDAAGEVLAFAQADATVRITATVPTGVYLPVGPEAEAADLTLEVTGSGTLLVVAVRDSVGVETVFKTRTAAAEAPQVLCRSHAGCGSRLRVA